MVAIRFEKISASDNHNDSITKVVQGTVQVAQFLGDSCENWDTGSEILGHHLPGVASIVSERQARDVCGLRSPMISNKDLAFTFKPNFHQALLRGMINRRHGIGLLVLRITISPSRRVSASKCLAGLARRN
jgi:hypothetical protein